MKECYLKPYGPQLKQINTTRYTIKYTSKTNR